MNHNHKPQPTLLEIKEQLNRIEREIGRSDRKARNRSNILIGLEIMDKVRLQRLLKDVTDNTDAVAANTKAWTEAIASIRAAQGDQDLPPEVEAALSQIEANTAALAAAPIAGTAADPGTTGGTPVVVPPVVESPTP
jgi:hypothetical protein